MNEKIKFSNMTETEREGKKDKGHSLYSLLCTHELWVHTALFIYLCTIFFLLCACHATSASQLTLFRISYSTSERPFLDSLFRTGSCFQIEQTG